MSGKAPPTGPRALLGKQGQQPHLSPQPGHANTRQSQLANGGGNGGPSSGLGSSSSPSSMNSRFGAAPPTGPRSLSVNGLPRGGKSKIFVNGHVGGRERDREREGSSNWPGKGQNRYGNTSPNPNGNTLTPGKFSISIPTKKPESSVLPRSSIQLRGEAFQVQPAKASPPQPSDEPPPPPPPDRSPPPIPPAGSPPPPPSLPPPPPTNSPPPPPQSPPPPPPPSLPPPPTPTEISMSVPTGPRLLSAPAPTKNLASHNAISIALPTSRVTNPAATPTPAQIQMQPAKPASPSSPKPQSLPSIPHWPPSRHHFPSDVRSHRVIYDPAVPLLPVHEHGSKDLKEKEKDARLDRDRAIDRTALISGYMKLGVHSQKPDPPSSDDLDFVAIMDIDSSKGEGTSTGAGTLAGALYGRSYRGGKEKSSGSEYFDGLIAAIRRKNHLGDDVSLPYPRIQGKGKGKESITRYDGEVLAGGDWFWVPEGDVQGGLASTLTKSSSPSAPTTSPSLPVPLESVSSSASAFLAKFSSGTAGVGVVAPADSLSHLLGHGNEERGYWICERAPVPRDPRMVRDRDKAGEGHNGSAELYLKERENRTRTQFYALDNYEYDPQTSTAPPPPTRLVITNISLLTPSAVLRAHFSQYGNIMSFEPQIDKQNGSPLGIVSIRFYNHSEAKKCLEKENGQKRPWAGAGYGPNGVGSIHGLGGKGDGGDQIQVEFDGNGDILATLMKELDDRKYGRKKKEVPPTPTIATANGSGGSGGGGGGGGSIRIPADHSSFTPTQTQAPSFKLPPGLPPRPPSGPPTSIPLHSSASGGVSPAVSRPGLPLLHPSLPMRPPVDSREGRDRDRDRDRLLATPASSGPTIYGGSTPRPNGIVTPSSSAAGPSASLPSSLPVNPSIPNKPSEFTIANAKVKMRQAPLALLKARASVKKDLVRKQEGDDDLGASGIGNGTPVQIRLERQAAEKEKAKEKEWGRSRDKEWDRGRDRGREYDSGRRRSVSKERDRFHDRPLGPWHNSASASPLRESSRRDRDIRERRGRDRDRNNSQSRSRSRSSYDDNRTYIPSRSTYAGGKSSYHGGRRHSPSYQRRDGHRYNRARMSRSPSPGFRPHMRSSWQRDHDEVIAELRKSELDHLKLEPDSGGQFPEQVQEDDVKALLMQFNADKIFKSSQGIFATFSVDAARRAAYYINANMDLKLGYLKVKATPCAPPSLIKTTWDDEEMVSKAQEILTEELKRALQQDILSRFIGPQLKSIIHQHQNESTDIGSISVVDQINTRQQGLVGLSFRKQRKDKKLVKEDLAPEVDELLEEEEPRPKKKRKKERVLPPKKQRKQVVEEEEEEDQLESEVEDITIPTDERIKKRPLEVESELSEDEEPAQKRSKVEDIKRKRVAKKKDAKQSLDDEEIDIVPPVQDRLTPGIDSSLSPSRSLSPVVGRTLTTPPPPPPPPNPTDDVCDDDEDFYYAKLVLSGRVPAEETTPEPSEDSAESGKPVIRKHITGSARTEGFYKITHAEKATYVTQYQMRSTNKAAAAAQEVVEETVPQHITSSRSNRANARRRAQGLEEINQVQRAVALSKGEAANELSFKFNQLQTRKKHLRFARSPIHDWGLYAMERIARGEMVIEYVGEVIRAQVAEKREKTYVRQGIGSSYLFRIDEDLVVDATKKGNLGRLINHSCDPNCTAKIITISGEKKIVIYAKQDIELGDEITYDYHFPFEQDKIPCLCGSAKCRGFLN